MAPLEESDYASGKTIEHEDGQQLLVLDTITTGGGRRFVIVRPHDSDVAALIPEDSLKDGACAYKSAQPATAETDETDPQGSGSGDSGDGS